MRFLPLLQATFGLILVAAIHSVLAGERTGASPDRETLKEHLAALLEVEHGGEGNVAASAAWRTVADADVDCLTDVLSAADQANPLAANWIAAAAETIVDRAAQSETPLPLSELRAFVLDTSHAPRTRRLAFEWLKGAEPERAEAMTLGFLHDPSAELRRDAVARLLAFAATESANPPEGNGAANEKLRSIYREALSGACDLDQVKTIQAALEKLGEKVDLAEHFGFISHWKVIGPFDNRGGEGFDTEYPPEHKVDLSARYEGKPRADQSRQVEWKSVATQDEFGVVDLNKTLGQENGVAAYAWCEFWSDRQRPAELRIGRDNAVKLWLNGALVVEERVYHSGALMDTYIGHGTLKPGRNTILLKVLQNEQKEDWAQGWGFQLRVCDRAGQAILSTKRKSEK